MVSEGIQKLSFCESNLASLKKDHENSAKKTDVVVYENEDLIISFSVGTILGIVVYKQLYDQGVIDKWQ